MSIDTRLHLETPEQVELVFDLAGPGSRFCAWVIDILLIWLILIGCAILALVLGVSLDALWDADFGSGTWRFAAAVIVIIAFGVMMGYHIAAELMMRGQTPGKRQVGLRVVRDDGTALRASESVVRNLVRIVDFLPVFYGLGGAVCLLHPAHKRLGDLAAGTIVVKEAAVDYRAESDRKRATPQVEVTAANSQLAPAERRAVAGFIERRAELLPEARQALAQRLAQPLHAKYGGRWNEAEDYLLRLVEGRHHGD